MKMTRARFRGLGGRAAINPQMAQRESVRFLMSCECDNPAITAYFRQMFDDMTAIALKNGWIKPMKRPTDA